MTRHVRVEFPGAIYHITIRGNGRQSILGERRRNSALRPIAARMLVTYSGVTHRQVADTLGMKSGVTAGVQVRKAVGLKENSRKAGKLIAAIEEVLDRQISENNQA